MLIDDDRIIKEEKEYQTAGLYSAVADYFFYGKKISRYMYYIFCKDFENATRAVNNIQSHFECDIDTIENHKSSILILDTLPEKCLGHDNIIKWIAHNGYKGCDQEYKIYLKLKYGSIEEHFSDWH